VLLSCGVGVSVPQDSLPVLQAVMISADAVNPRSLSALREDGWNGVVLELRPGQTEPQAEARAAAAGLVSESGLDLYYWIEVGRCPEMANAHPQWMASLQGHPEWRRLFPDFPAVERGQVVKCYPWVPVLYEEAFAAHRDRLERLLAGQPPARGIFLNDLQGAPSACGCGNDLCRWTADYGPVRTATRAGEGAAARFVEAVRQLAPRSDIIPVWVTECEEEDGEPDGPCAGVGCFRGKCWPEYTRQLMPLAEESDRLAVLLPVHDFQRELPRYGSPAGWVGHALGTFQSMPPRHGGRAVASSRLIAVLQGWGCSPADVTAQRERAVAAGVHGIVVSRVPIDQSWQPRLLTLPPGR
jgi:hypothetical protein